MDEILRNMIKDFYMSRNGYPPVEIDAMEERQLINKLKEYLLEQRYLIVFDDIWKIRFWGHTKLALPDNNKGSRIVITTLSESAAPSKKESPFYHLYKMLHLPIEKAWELFCKKVFQCEGGNCPPELVSFSRLMIEKCERLPLAIMTIGGLLSTKEKVASEWCKFHDSLSSKLESNPHLEEITKILSLSYFDLPHNLKACFLYFGMFPEDYAINCARLIRLWMAEGFIRENSGLKLEDIAKDYLNQLILRSLVQVVTFDIIGRARTCRVHDMLREVILSKSEELNFHLVSMQDCLSFGRIARRLSIQNSIDTSLKSSTSSQTRSILILGVDKVPNSFLINCFANYKLLKTMDFEGTLIDYIPEEVGNLFHLRHLSPRDTKVKMLPKSIGELHNLETLDLKRSLVSELPAEINGLCKLRYLAVYVENFNNVFDIDFRQAIQIPSGIGSLKSLQKLFKIEANNTAFIEELGSLAQLRKLQISKLKRENGTALCIALEKMGHLWSLYISSTSEEEVLDLQLMSSPPPLLQTLCQYGRLEKLPEWIFELNNIAIIGLYRSRLMDDPLTVLQTLRNLTSLWLYDGYGGEQLDIEGGGFLRLKVLGLENLGELNKLIIGEGVLPLLEMLVIGPSPQLKEVPSGIHHLKSLKNIEFYDMPREFMLSLQPNNGSDFGTIKHIPSVTFWYRIQGQHYKGYNLGQSELLQRLQN